MGERVLIINDKESDLDLFREILGPKGFDIESISRHSQVEEMIQEDAFDAILADYDLIGEKAFSWLALLKENRTKTCFILYGEKIQTDNISEILQKGAYGFIPRNVLSDRLYDTLLGGLENRKAFIEILGMYDELREVNERLEGEKETLGLKNQESGFVNRLSSEVAYDLNWDRILPRILDVGLLKVIDFELFSILYRIGSKWNLALHLSEKEIHDETIERFKEDIINRFLSLSRERISMEEVAFHLYPSHDRVSSSSPISLTKQWVRPLRLAGRVLGMLVILPKNRKKFKDGQKELISTISNILAMSMKNAQEYHRLKEMAVTDSLTGIYNYKGLRDFMKREFQRARRYNKTLSLIMIDVDNFKTINDSHGHQAGDYVLRDLAGCLKSSVRGADIVSRYGGDEFAILLPETDTRKAKVLVKRMLRSIKNHAFEWGPEKIKVEISYGISSLTEIEKGKGEEEFINKADERLYDAKRSRNFMYPMSREA